MFAQLHLLHPRDHVKEAEFGGDTVTSDGRMIAFGAAATVRF